MMIYGRMRGGYLAFQSFSQSVYYLCVIPLLVVEEEHRADEGCPGAEVAVTDVGKRVEEGEHDKSDRPPDNHEHDKDLVALLRELGGEQNTDEHNCKRDASNSNSVGCIVVLTSMAALCDSREEHNKGGHKQDSIAVSKLGEAVNRVTHASDSIGKKHERAEQPSPGRKVAVAGHDKGCV
mmetsp:Transcript_11350/g.22168  ORF Transcript_11350/g.22168 Transcript_11350/m.22168 type:complete len:180 (-) Transcript_11350:651-1190(-)